MAPPPALRAGYVKSLADDMSACHRPREIPTAGDLEYQMLV